ncbi:MAG: hypothetical protein Q4D41_03780 [Prevotellaceae bacterium]|nr:hypothetical protein [Prevotellaceae bacterium]
MKKIGSSDVLCNMRLFVLLLVIVFSNAMAFAQDTEIEKTSPLTDMEIVRQVKAFNIEGRSYFDVMISLKSLSPSYWGSDKYRVKVNIVDKYGNSIYKKTFKNSFLYLFSDGQIQVGKKNFTQILILRNDSLDESIGVIREKEGIFY